MYKFAYCIWFYKINNSNNYLFSFSVGYPYIYINALIDPWSTKKSNDVNNYIWIETQQNKRLFSNVKRLQFSLHPNFKNNCIFKTRHSNPNWSIFSTCFTLRYRFFLLHLVLNSRTNVHKITSKINYFG